MLASLGASVSSKIQFRKQLRGSEILLRKQVRKQTRKQLAQSRTSEESGRFPEDRPEGFRINRFEREIIFVSSHIYIYMGYGSLGAPDWCKILLQDVGMICQPGNH
jgi:hypothetical protein